MHISRNERAARPRVLPVRVSIGSRFGLSVFPFLLCGILSLLDSHAWANCCDIKANAAKNGGCTAIDTGGPTTAPCCSNNVDNATTCTNAGGTFYNNSTGMTCNAGYISCEPAASAFVPPPGPITRCENSVAQGVARLEEAILHCHRARARGALPDDAAEEACETTAKDHFQHTNISMCSSCMDLVTLANSVEGVVDNILSGQIFCDSTTGIPLDDEPGLLRTCNTVDSDLECRGKPEGTACSTGTCEIVNSASKGCSCL